MAEIVRGHIREVVEFHKPLEPPCNGVRVTSLGRISVLGEQKVIFLPTLCAVPVFHQNRCNGGYNRDLANTTFRFGSADHNTACGCVCDVPIDRDNISFLFAINTYQNIQVVDYFVDTT